MSITGKTRTRGIFVCTLSPFDEDGAIKFDAISDQASRLSRIEGVLGIAVSTSMREGQILSRDERLEIVCRTRMGLFDDQLLLACVGTLSAEDEDEVAACKEAGADAMITFPPSWRKGPGDAALNMRLDAFADLADRMPLPVILALGDYAALRPAISDEIAALAQHYHKLIGFDMDADDNVYNYGQDYFALEAVDRPLTCIPSSESSLSHNLNTGRLGILSCLAYVAPHEVTRLYQASRCDRFHDAQAIHNRLSPMATLLSGHDRDTRELIYREIAHRRGLLASTDARGVETPLCPHLRANLHQILEKIALEPISWV